LKGRLTSALQKGDRKVRKAASRLALIFISAIIRVVLKELDSSTLCLECGLCCNGVIFGNVKLQSGDVASRLRSLGLPVKARTFKQPCAAWQNCRCAIYADRPAHCRKFECLLLKDVEAKTLSPDEALKTIRRAQRKVAVVRKLLKALGSTDEGQDLRWQYRHHLAKLVESGPFCDEQASLYSRLTLEFHSLDQLLHRSFYQD